MTGFKKTKINLIHIFQNFEKESRSCIGYCTNEYKRDVTWNNSKPIGLIFVGENYIFFAKKRVSFAK